VSINKIHKAKKQNSLSPSTLQELFTEWGCHITLPFMRKKEKKFNLHKNIAAALKSYGYKEWLLSNNSTPNTFIRADST
jgi:hypothetical protein